jgi:flagellar biosynthesis protein FliR
MYGHEWLADLRALPAMELFILGLMLGIALTLLILAISGGHGK